MKDDLFTDSMRDHIDAKSLLIDVQSQCIVTTTRDRSPSDLGNPKVISESDRVLRHRVGPRPSDKVHAAELL